MSIHNIDNIDERDEDPVLTCWVTRGSAFSIQCGGLERLSIWFSKPIYYYEKYSERERDNLFGYIGEEQGLYRKSGWHSNDKTWVTKQSVGNWIGYDNKLSQYIWKKLCEHFHNEDFDEWHNIEKEGRSNVEDFCLEIKISISLFNK